VQYLVTEYGIANLKGRSLRERAKELIRIAHPKFREDLERQAREFWGLKM
jgi:4-hydroxybutyrate CoA-transferase